MDEKVSVEKINIKIGEIEIALSPAAASELRDLLNDLFGETEKTVYIPSPYPVYPYYPYCPPCPYDRWTITWGTDNDTTETWDGTVTYCLSE